MAQPSTGAVYCAFSPKALTGLGRTLVRVQPCEPLDSGWRVGVPGEPELPEASWLRVPWPQAVVAEPILAQLGDAPFGASFVLRREGSAPPELRDGVTGALVPTSPQAPLGAPSLGLGLAGHGELEAAALRDRVIPALRAAAGTPSEAVLSALWGSAVLVPMQRSDGAPLVESGAGLAFSTADAAFAWQAERGVGESAAPLEMVPFDRLVQALSGKASVLVVDAGQPSALSLELTQLERGALAVDSEALLALRGRDPERFLALLKTPGRVWIALRDAADRTSQPLYLRDHSTGASVLALFASEADAVAFDDLSEPLHLNLDSLRANWEPEVGVILGLGSDERPLELGWGRLRAEGFMAQDGREAWAAPAPLAADAVDEPLAVRPVPVHGVQDAWSQTVGVMEREVMDAVLELPRVPVDAASVLVRLRHGQVQVALAYSIDGVAHSAAHTAGGSMGTARVALLRLRVIEAVLAWVAQRREQRQDIPDALRFQVLPGGAGGAAGGAPSHASLTEDLVAWLRGQGMGIHECLDKEAVVTGEGSPVSLAQAAERGDVDGALRALGAGAAVWAVLDANGALLKLQHGESGRSALAVFTSQDRAAAFAPAGESIRAWAEDLAAGLGGDAFLIVDPGVAPSALVLERAAVHWPVVQDESPYSPA